MSIIRTVQFDILKDICITHNMFNTDLSTANVLIYILFAVYKIYNASIWIHSVVFGSTN